MSVGGAFLGQSSNWMAWERDHRLDEMLKSKSPERCTLAEAAAAHDGKVTIIWLAELYQSLKR